MPIKKSLSRRSFYNCRRYWYHLSSTLVALELTLTPWDNDDPVFNRSYLEPNIKRICVGPSISHCLTALPYSFGTSYYVYRTKNPVKADAPRDVFDASVTKEGWIKKPTEFIKIGILSFEDVEKGEKIDNVIEEAASGYKVSQCRKVLKWWKKVNPRKYVVKT